MSADLPGRLVALEGIDGGGKSSLLRALPDELRDCKVGVVTTGEMQSSIGDELQAALDRQASPLVKTYLFAADRALTYEDVARPALERGDLVIWDRYVDSAIVYRAVEGSRVPRPVSPSLVRKVNAAFLPAHLTILLDLPSQEAVQRGKADAYPEDFLEDARRMYLARATIGGHVVLDAREDPTVLARQAAAAIRTLLPGLF